MELADNVLSAGETLSHVVRALLDATLENIRNEEPLFLDVAHRLGGQPITEFDIVYALGWLGGLADAYDRGPRRIA